MEKESILPDFQEFLRYCNLVHEKYIPYFAHWVSRFLYFCNNNTQSDHARLILEFIDSFKKDKNISDWQLRQAQQVV
jgi:3-methyladenine DNA glycosylase AlkC